LILVAIAGVAACFLLKSRAVVQPTAAPAEGTTASGIVDASQPPSASPPEIASKPASQASVTGVANSEPHAASSLDIRSLAHCHDALLNKQAAAARVGCDDTPANDASALRLCRKLQPQMAQQLQEATAEAASCPQDLAKAATFYESMKAIAVRGDVPAQRCFIQGYFASASGEGEDATLTQEQLDEYPSLVKKFIDEALARGDWSVVRWLGRVTLNMQDGMLNAAYPMGSTNLETAYRMKYLLRMGNQPDTQGDDPRMITDLWQKNQLLTAQQIKDGQAWAREQFGQHFNGSQEGASITDTNFCEHR
jgi:hypothetical protein